MTSCHFMTIQESLRAEHLCNDFLGHYRASCAPRFSTAFINAFVRCSWFGAERSHRANMSDVGEIFAIASSIVMFFVFICVPSFCTHIYSQRYSKNCKKNEKKQGKSGIRRTGTVTLVSANLPLSPCFLFSCSVL